jgi:hypothetical protein
MSAFEFSTVQCVLKTVFNPASLTGTYQVMNGTGFSDTAKILKLYNGSSTVAIDISLDGVNDHDFIPPLGTLIVDFQTNHYDGGSYGTGTLVVREGQLLWGKTAATPTYLQIIGYR